jgi:hypothetical protein
MPRSFVSGLRKGWLSWVGGELVAAGMAQFGGARLTPTRAGASDHDLACREGAPVERCSSALIADAGTFFPWPITGAAAMRVSKKGQKLELHPRFLPRKR